MKKCICTLLMITMIITALPVFAEIQDENDIAALLYELNIMRGDPDGNLRLDDSVTRAEFCKIAIAASEYRNSVATNLTISPFKDVNYDFWGAPYIKLAVSKKYVLGYPDGSFQPDSRVLYEEALTICLKILGYTDDDFGASWPYGQVGLATNLELTKDISGAVGSGLTRRDVMRIVFNMLGINQKNGAAPYISTLGYTVYEDAILIATANEDASVGANKILTSAGTFTLNNPVDDYYIGRKGDIVTKSPGDFISFIPNEQSVKSHNIYQVLNSKIAVMNNGNIENLDIDKSVVLYNKSHKTTLNDMMANLAAGDIITVYTNENNTIDYCFITTDTTVGPVTAWGGEWMATLNVSADGLTVMRDGLKSTPEAVSAQDILYYSKVLNTVWAYSKKITGIYEKASPNKDMPDTITVSGVEYKLESTAAFDKVSSSGQFAIGDTVILMMGRNGQVADVAAPGTSAKQVVGYMLESGKKTLDNIDNQTYSAYYAKIAMADGDIKEYVTAMDYSYCVNSVVKLTFTGNQASVSRVPSVNNVYGRFNSPDYKIGTNDLSTAVKIMDVINTDYSEVGGYVYAYPQRLDAMTLEAKDVLFVNRNSNNQIDTLILNDVTGDIYKYGLVTKVAATPVSEISKSIVNGIEVQNEKLIKPSGGNGIILNATFTCEIGGKTTAIEGSSLACVGDVVQILMPEGSTANGGGAGKASSKLSVMNKLSSLTEITETYLQSGGEKYLIDINATVYRKNKGGSYFLEPNKSSLLTADLKKITAFYDKKPSKGGRVRLIIISE